jgi:hypothetical protein
MSQEKRKIENVDISEAKSIILPPEEEIKAKAKREKEKNLKIQIKVDEYNKALLEIDPSFATKTFVGNEIRVRLKKDDYIIRNSGSRLKDGVKKDNLIALMTEDGKDRMIENPLPYMYEGVVVAIPNAVKKHYLDEYGVNLEPGTYVELKEFNLQNQRYYLNKANIDTKVSLEDLMAGKSAFPNHEGYFTIGAYDIESIL